ncbi:MAG: TolC family protein [Verrucomicrobiota bacterium]
MDLDFANVWELALSHRPDLQILERQLEQRFLQEKGAKNALLPELDLRASVGRTGSTEELSGVIDQLRRRDAPYFTLGLSLSLPLGHKREKENFRIARAETARAKLRLRQFHQTVMIQIDDAIGQARTDFERIGATREAREFAEKALSSEQEKLSRGASTNFIVLQLQRNLTAARSDEIRSLVDYNRSLSRLRFLQGTSLKNHQVELTVE